MLKLSKKGQSSYFGKYFGCQGFIFKGGATGRIVTIFHAILHNKFNRGGTHTNIYYHSSSGPVGRRVIDSKEG